MTGPWGLQQRGVGGAGRPDRVDGGWGRGRLPNLAAIGINRLSGRNSKGSWRNWQTRKVEGLVPARACWFDSSRAHLVKNATPTRLMRFAAVLNPR